MNAYIRLLRPHQYLKNLFIFFPLFFGLQISDSLLLGRVALAAALFSLLASAVYIFNDLRDIESDRLHPVKRRRPLAAGEVTLKSSLFLMFCCAAAGLGICFWLLPEALPVMTAYLIMNLLYSLKLKHIPIVDVSIIALGFVLRLLIGSQVTGIDLSKWIILMTFLGALFVALAKRRDDVMLFVNSGNKMRKAVDGYNAEFLNASMVIMAAILIVAYLMYTVSPEVTQRVQTDNLYMTAVFVIVGIMRYLQITLVENDSGSPTRILLHDFFLQATIVGWLISFVWILYYTP